MFWFSWIVALFAGLLEPLEGVRLLGQESGNFGGFDADVTAFERDGVPGVLVRLHNASDKQAWWAADGGWSSSGSWGISRDGRGGRGQSSIGCSPPYGKFDREPTSAELSKWLVPAGAYRFYELTYDGMDMELELATEMDGVREPVELGVITKWSTSFDMSLPVWEEPTLYDGAWVQMVFKIKIGHGGEDFQLDLVGKRRR